MATTTTNFGWDIPQSTDLVKDGATAIAALGQDIDTALVDLKGGTTGQVLAKASGTDLDYSWVTTDDTNAIQNAIVDAKGDLIAASAADTPARLPVGANDLFIIAASGETTGLKYSGTWTSYTPTVAQNGARTITVNYAKYLQIGKMLTVQVECTITNTGTAGSVISCSLPITASSASGNRTYGSFSFLDAGNTFYVGSVVIQGANAQFLVDNNGNYLGALPNFAVANNDVIAFTMIYEVA
jgi:hypothetical protein